MDFVRLSLITKLKKLTSQYSQHCIVIVASQKVFLKTPFDISDYTVVVLEKSKYNLRSG